MNRRIPKAPIGSASRDCSRVNANGRESADRVTQNVWNYLNCLNQTTDHGEQSRGRLFPNFLSAMQALLVCSNSAPISWLLG